MERVVDGKETISLIFQITFDGTIIQVMYHSYKQSVQVTLQLTVTALSLPRTCDQFFFNVQVLTNML